MTRMAIRAEQISKRYTIGAKQRAYGSLRESITSTLSAPIRALTKSRIAKNAERDERVIWALKDVSFGIAPGEVVGVIGRNGAGKSTLLKVLSRITEPTSGVVDLYGRLGSLLEVGTGFHGELTGRENIYLNGAILGMRRADIHRQFDRIVAFAEVEKFIDTPVKHYSTGMYMRLAFGVAAHLEPEILLIDEVLAVGDVAFQKKCLGRIGEVAADGRTVLFVSHNMGAIRSLCTKGLLMDGGQVAYFGSIGKSIEMYFKLAGTVRTLATENDVPLPGFGPVSITGTDGTIDQSEGFEIRTTLQIPPDAAGFTLVCVLEDCSQRNMFHLRIDSTEFKTSGGWSEPQEIRLKLPALWLEPGVYTLWFKALCWGESAQSRIVSDILHVDVGGKSSGWNSVLSPNPQWHIETCKTVPSNNEQEKVA
jgi:lipopolysaccharide transport system ATP-binding protein